MSVEYLDLVAFPLQQRARAAIFERQMRLATAEINAVLKAPGRIDERDSHATASCIVCCTTEDWISQSRSRLRPASTSPPACQPGAPGKARVSDTYQG